MFWYDLNSNRIQGHVGNDEFDAVYDNQDRLIRFNDQTFSYNANGDLISIKELEKKHHKPNYKTTNVVYDVFGNLIQFGNITNLDSRSLISRKWLQALDSLSSLCSRLLLPRCFL